MTADRARALCVRLARMTRSPGVALDATDRHALEWALSLATSETQRLELAERWLAGGGLAAHVEEP